MLFHGSRSELVAPARLTLSSASCATAPAAAPAPAPAAPAAPAPAAAAAAAAAAVQVCDHFAIFESLQEILQHTRTLTAVASMCPCLQWSLGEHGEWAKHTNFELDTHAPWILSLPPQADSSASTEASLTQPYNRVTLYTEHVDILPTLLEAAAGVVVPDCVSARTQQNLCTMGRSRVALLDPLAVAAAALSLPRADSNDNAAFSQYRLH